MSLILLLIVIIGINTFRFGSKQLQPAGQRKVFETDTIAVRRLSESLRFETISYDKDSLNKNNLVGDTAMFRGFISYLQASYPEVFQKLEFNIINNYNLLLHWKSQSEKRPVILYAHMDVVPAYSKNDSSGWEKDPFAGINDGEFIYGRGAIDDKGSVIGLLESVDRLLKKNTQPKRDVYIAFGCDEEAGGLEGAKKIADYLEQKNVKAEFLLDEGGLVAEEMVPFVSPPVALVFTSEKGYMMLELTVKGDGGHSSHPPLEAPVELLSAAIQKLHDHPFESRMTEAVENFMDYAGPEMRMPFKALFANRWLFRPVIFGEYKKIPSARAMITTTSVATIISGGSKENVVPSLVSARLNFRLLPGDRSQDILKKVEEIINDKRVEVRISGTPEEASSVSSVESESFRLLQRTIGKVFPDAVVAPSLLIAQTDSKHFRRVTENIYRFLPVRMNDKILDTMHGKGEKIRVKDFMEAIEFYEELIVDL